MADEQREMIGMDREPGVLELGMIHVAVDPKARDYDNASVAQLRSMGVLLGVPNARRKGAERLRIEIKQVEAARALRYRNDTAAIDQWRLDVADLIGKKPWEMTRAQWQRAQGLVRSAVYWSKRPDLPYDMSNLKRAMDVFATTFGYANTGAFATRWAESNSRHEVQVAVAIEHGVVISPGVMADYTAETIPTLLRFDPRHLRDLLLKQAAAMPRPAQSTRDA